MSKKILLVEDEAIVALSEAKMLQKHGFEVKTTHDGQKALEMIDKNPDITLVLMDIDLGEGIDGTETAQRILEKREIPIIFLTGHAEQEYVEKVKKITGYGYVLKNSGEFVLIESTNMAYTLFKSKQEAQHHLEQSQKAYQELTEVLNKYKEAEKEIGKREENLRITLNSIGDAVIAADTNGYIERMNPVAEKLCGWDQESARGRFLHEVFHIRNVDTRELVQNPIEEVLQKGRIVGLANHTLLISKNGQEYQIADSAAPIRDDNGEQTGVVLVFRDVTEQYEKQRLIKESERRYRGLFNSIRDAILVADTQRNIIDCNQTFTELFGYELEEIRGEKTVSVYADEQEFTQMGRAIKEHKGDVTDFVFTVHYKKKDGTVFPGETNVFYLQDEEGNTTGFIGLIRDITERKKREDKLRESERRLDTLMDNLPGMAYRCHNDRRWTMEFVSRGCLDLTGYSAEELEYNQMVAYGDIIVQEERESVWNSVQEALNRGSRFKIQYRIRTKTGEIRWVWEQGVGIFSPDNTLRHIEGFITDITEQRKVRDEIDISSNN
jgi:PAS domain S-box-containing protein